MNTVASVITLDGTWGNVSLSSSNSFYLAGIKESKGTTDTVDPKDVKRVSFEVGIDVEAEAPLTIGMITLNFDEVTSRDAELNAKTALVRCTGYPKDIKIRPIQIYTDKECFTKDCQTKISVNLKEVQLF